LMSGSPRRVASEKFVDMFRSVSDKKKSAVGWPGTRNYSLYGQGFKGGLLEILSRACALATIVY